MPVRPSSFFSIPGALTASVWAASAAVLGRAGGTCLVCRAWCVGGVCDPCLARFAAPVPRCDGCALEVPAGASRCGACLLEPLLQRRSVAALAYAYPWDDLVLRFKYRESPALAVPLARRCVAALQAVDTASIDLVLPVPLAPPKLRERGYNQAWELARRIGPALGLPSHAGLLQRVLDGPSQQGGSRDERLQQVRHAFALAPGAQARLQGRHVALVDDVMTTGATAHAAAATLLRAGAAAVDVWVLARTADPRH